MPEPVGEGNGEGSAGDDGTWPTRTTRACARLIAVLVAIGEGGAIVAIGEAIWATTAGSAGCALAAMADAAIASPRVVTKSPCIMRWFYRSYGAPKRAADRARVSLPV